MKNLFLILLVATSIGCASSESGSSVGGDMSVDDMSTADMGGPEEDVGNNVVDDVGSNPDADQPDMGSNDMDDQDAGPVITGPTRSAISSGGGTRASESYQLEVQVGAPTSATRFESENYRIGVGVGPFVEPGANSGGTP